MAELAQIARRGPGAWRPRAAGARVARSCARAPRLSRAEAVGPSARAPIAIAALAVGATAIGAFAIGRLSVGRLAVRRASFGRVEIEQLEVGRLTVREGAGNLQS